jgi:hypothetical protein
MKTKLVNENGFPKPLKANCFKCGEDFFIKFVISQKNYSTKNSWERWTGQEGNKKVCNSCLKNLYYDKPVYWKTITDLRKRNLLKSYIRTSLI